MASHFAPSILVSVTACHLRSWAVTWSQMEPIDVDEIIDVNFPDSSDPDEGQSVELIFKDGTKRIFSGAELPEVL